MSKTVPSPSSASSPSGAESPGDNEVTADNAAEILAADDDPSISEADSSGRNKPSRRALLTVGGLARHRRIPDDPAHQPRRGRRP